jgi:hypothetical protein
VKVREDVVDPRTRETTRGEYRTVAKTKLGEIGVELRRTDVDQQINLKEGKVSVKKALKSSITLKVNPIISKTDTHPPTILKSLSHLGGLALILYHLTACLIHPCTESSYKQTLYSGLFSIFKRSPHVDSDLKEVVRRDESANTLVTISLRQPLTFTWSQQVHYFFISLCCKLYLDRADKRKLHKRCPCGYTYTTTDKKQVLLARRSKLFTMAEKLHARLFDVDRMAKKTRLLKLFKRVFMLPNSDALHNRTN